MSFILKNTAENLVVNNNQMTEQDFNKNELVENDWLEKILPFGKARMKDWIFDGIRMVFSDWNFTKPVELEWQSSWETVTLYFNLKGTVSVSNSKDIMHQLQNNQQNMFYGNDRAGVFKTDDLRMQAFRIHFNSSAFLRIAGEGSDTLKRFAENVVNRKATVLSDISIPLDTTAQAAISSIMNCRFNNSLKRIFLLSKAMELLVLQADAFSKSQHIPNSEIKSDHDRDRIFFARDYMLKNIDNPPSIPELARIAAINEFKLKKGYKQLFGNTIFGDLSDVRLEKAKHMLHEKDTSVTDVAFTLGYSTVQHFSQVFKKKFGFSPKKIAGGK